MSDSLSYTQRLKLGAIRVRRDFADQARQRAAAAALLNDHLTCEALHAEADQHEAAIIEAARELAAEMHDQGQLQLPSQRVVRGRLLPVEPVESAPAGRVAWRGGREAKVAGSRQVAWRDS